MVMVTKKYKVIISVYNISAYLFRTPTFRKDLLHILTLLKESWTLFIECFGAVETVEHFTPVHANYEVPHGGSSKLLFTSRRRSQVRHLLLHLCCWEESASQVD